MQTKILFATDGREPAKDAGRLLRRLVDPGDVTLTILHAAPRGDGHVVQSGAQTILDEAQHDAFDAGIKAAPILTVGAPDVAIEQELGFDEYGLVVVGAGNHPWSNRLVLGTVSTELLHDAAVPVLAVHRFRDGDDGHVRVLVGVDGSASVERAIDTLIAVSSPTSVAIEVRSVIPTLVLSAAGYPGAFVPPTFIDEVTEQREQAAHGYVTEAVKRFAAAGYTAESSVGEGDPATNLLERGKVTDADLIVVGARGLGAIARLAVGSVSGHVARHAPAALVAHAIAKQTRR